MGAHIGMNFLKFSKPAFCLSKKFLCSFDHFCRIYVRILFFDFSCALHRIIQVSACIFNAPLHYGMSLL